MRRLKRERQRRQRQRETQKRKETERDRAREMQRETERASARQRQRHRQRETERQTETEGQRQKTNAPTHPLKHTDLEVDDGDGGVDKHVQGEVQRVVALRGPLGRTQRNVQQPQNSDCLQ
jgi:hypothetical protein